MPPSGPSSTRSRSGSLRTPARDLALEASSGATDFGLYFFYFSFFLVVSALLLASLFFRLGVEQRLSEIGVLRAAGFPPGAIRRVFTAEAALLSVAGSVIGVLGAIAYAELIHVGASHLVGGCSRDDAVEPCGLATRAGGRRRRWRAVSTRDDRVDAAVVGFGVAAPPAHRRACGRCRVERGSAPIEGHTARRGVHGVGHQSSRRRVDRVIGNDSRVFWWRFADACRDACRGVGLASRETSWAHDRVGLSGRVSQRDGPGRGGVFCVSP